MELNSLQAQRIAASITDPAERDARRRKTEAEIDMLADQVEHQEKPFVARENQVIDEAAPYRTAMLDAYLPYFKKVTIEGASYRVSISSVEPSDAYIRVTWDKAGRRFSGGDSFNARLKFHNLESLENAKRMAHEFDRRDIGDTHFFTGHAEIEFDTGLDNKKSKEWIKEHIGEFIDLEGLAEIKVTEPEVTAPEKSDEML